MNDVGRNDPCPCGSGRKYKRCCLDRTDHLDDARELHDLDQSLVARILDWAESEARPLLDEALEELGAEDVDEIEDWERSLLATVAPAGKQTLAEHYRKAHQGRLGPAVMEWLDALAAAWLSLWEVVAVEPGRSVALHDRLTGERRRIVEQSLTEFVMPRQVILGRVVDARGMSVLAGAHPLSLGPWQAAEAAELFTEEVLGGRRAKPEDLRLAGAMHLFFAWEEAIQPLEDEPLPTLTNFDGDPLQETVDVFAVAAGAADDVARRLEALEGLEADRAEPDEEGARWFTWSDDEHTVLASFRLQEDRLEVRTTSETRADTARTRVEGALGARVTHVDRERKDIQDFLASRMGRQPSAAPPPGPQGPEVDAILRGFKEKHYATWPDEPLPMLDGLAPRDAVGDPVLRRRIVAALKDIERMEAREEPGRRYDVDVLRRALGIGSDE